MTKCITPMLLIGMAAVAQQTTVNMSP